MIRKINGVNVRNFDYNNATVSHTGNTIQTKLMSVLIPANTFKNGDLIDIEGVFYKTGTAGSYTYRFYWHTLDQISGATLLGTRAIGAANIFASGSRRLSVRIADGSGSAPNIGTHVISVSAGLYNEYQSNAHSDLALNWTVDSYLMASIALSSAADTATQLSFKIWTY
jgi:hypothetical protein